MKKTVIIITGLLMLVSTLGYSQTIIDPKKETKEQGAKRVNKKIEAGVDAGFDKLEEGIGNIFGKKKKKKTKTKEANPVPEKSNTDEKQSTEEQIPEQPTQAINLQWSKFDFVPGDEVIFDDGPSADEENGEFPSRWDLVKGQVEIARVNGENVLMFIEGNPEIIPYLKNAKEDYLPDVFTIEFDFHRPAKGNRISVYLYDEKNQQNNSNMYMDIGYNNVSEKYSKISGEHPDFDYTWNEKPRWIHISIAFTKGKLKVYMDDTRVINIPHYEGNPSGLSLQAYWADMGENKPFYFKNIRIAKGGVKYYDRVLSDGKIIVNGIRFDINKSTIKPESNGAINKIFELMQKQPALKFSVEGHTDADGDEAANQTLSEARAKAVMDRLISMGISSNRLKSSGWGESKPIGENSTPEGKANNRRVEFVKFN